MSQTILFRTCVMLLALTCVTANVPKDVESRCNYGPCINDYCLNLSGEWYFKARLIAGNEYRIESGLEYGAAVGTGAVSDCDLELDGIAITLKDLNRDNVVQTGSFERFNALGTRFAVDGLGLACQVVKKHVKFVCVSAGLFPVGNISRLSPFGTYQWTFERGAVLEEPGYCPPAPSPTPVVPIPPTPSSPTPSTPSFPTPSFPTPSFPTPSFPTPSFPTPSSPTPSSPTPSSPTPSSPTPSSPTPSSPTPSSPTPSSPTPSSPTPIVLTPNPSFMTGSPEPLIPLEPEEANDDDLTDGEIAAIVIVSTLVGLAALAGLALLLFALIGGGSQVFQGAGPSMLRDNVEG